MKAVELEPEVEESLIRRFQEDPKKKDTIGRSTRVEAGVYEYKGERIFKVKIPNELSTKLSSEEAYIYYGWKIESVDNVIFRKKNNALDFIDGFIE